MSQHYTYLYFDENFIPYYVGKGIRDRDRRDQDHTVVPPPERILHFPQECEDAAHAFESYLIKRVGRRAEYAGNRVEEKRGPLMNRTDGGPGCVNPWLPSREADAKQAFAMGTVWGPIIGPKYIDKLLSATTYETRAKGGQIQGRILGRQNIENGHLARIRTPENQLKGTMKVNHNRWHVNRGIINPSCPLCR